MQKYHFFDRKGNFCGVIEGGMKHSAGLGDAACTLREQRPIAPRAQILHPKCCCLPLASNRRQGILGRSPACWDWAALAAGTLTALPFNADGEPQLASTVIDTIMAGLPGPRGAPGPIGPPGNKLSRAANPVMTGKMSKKKFLMETGVVCGMPAGKASGPHWKGSRGVGPGVRRVARSNQISYLLIAADCFAFGRTHLEKGIIKNCQEWVVQ